MSGRSLTIAPMVAAALIDSATGPRLVVVVVVVVDAAVVVEALGFCAT